MPEPTGRAFQLPDDVRAMGARGPDWSDWVNRLPRRLSDLLGEWQLTIDGVAMSGYASVVYPVRTAAGEPAVVKAGFDGTDETEHEALALQTWGGDGAVRLLRADPRRRALLMERVRQRDLTGLDVPAACEIVAGLYPRLHVAAPARMRPLTAYIQRWTEDLARLPPGSPLPRRLVQQAIGLAGDLVSDETSTGTLIHCDLHYRNVLAGDRAPWLVIDPQPKSGDPHYELAPMLWNRFDELGGDVRGGIRLRFHALVAAAGLDQDRARDWVVVREAHNAMWAVEQGDRRAATIAIAVAKAVQD